ncbi:MAG TPA: dihydropteroate synthase [Mycobacteriales bacterium]
MKGFADIGRCRVMGVLNVTPDSFSDGGAYLDPDAAIAHGVEMAAAGADVVDVGGESTRPGASRVDADEELRRVLPVVEALAGRVPVSIDTQRAAVAEACLAAGAVLVNDVSGGRADPAMLPLLAGAGAPVVLMHSRGDSADMTSAAQYDDVVGEVRDELRARLDAAVAAGVDADAVVLDPGIGFHKIGDQNWQVLAGLAAFLELGRPVLVGSSRKAFLGRLLATGDGPRPVGERGAASLAAAVLAAQAGAWGVRVHDVRPTVDALRVLAAWDGAR